MISLHQWAIRHHISALALQELEMLFGTIDVTPPDSGPHKPRSEAAVQANQRSVASARGDVLFRNMVGAAKMDDGSFLRFGLANDSKKMNETLKSSDLVGIHTFVVRPEHVGQRIGQFDVAEMKPEGWVFTGTDHESAQLAFIRMVVARGGRGRFINKMGEI